MGQERDVTAELLIAVAALLGSATAIGTLVVTRRNNRDEIDVKERTADVEIFVETIKELRTGLGEARAEATELQGALDHARADMTKLQQELTVALANVAILSDHIREHVDRKVPFPRLRQVWPSTGWPA